MRPLRPLDLGVYRGLYRGDRRASTCCPIGAAASIGRYELIRQILPSFTGLLCSSCATCSRASARAELAVPGSGSTPPRPPAGSIIAASLGLRAQRASLPRSMATATCLIDSLPGPVLPCSGPMALNVSLIALIIARCTRLPLPAAPFAFLLLFGSLGKLGKISSIFCFSASFYSSHPF